MTFQSSFNYIHHVEVHDDTIRMFQHNDCMVAIPKSALSVMIMLGENILLDLESRSAGRKKYWSDENSAIYTKRVFEVDNIHRDGIEERRVLCIMETPNEIVLKKEAFQLMLISAAVACRIEADPFKSPIGAEYGLNDTQHLILHDSKHFSIVDEDSQEQFALPMIALAKMIMLKKDILRDLRAKNHFGGKVYWSDNKHFQIKTEYLGTSGVVSFIADYRRYPVYIRIRDQAFEKIVQIATSGPSWTNDMDYTMTKIRDLFWKSIPINTVKSIEFSRNGREFTLLNEVNSETLTLPVAALKVAQRNKQRILSDLDDYSFMPTYEKDFMNEYWTDGVYALRTGAFINLSRDIDCNVVRFVRIKDNYYHFVVQKKAFLNLLEELQNSEEARNH